MWDIVRDSFFGQCLRLVTGGKVFLYEDEKHPELWEKYINKDKSANMALYGKTQAPETETKDASSDSDEKPEIPNDDDKEQRPDPSRHSSQSSTSTIVTEENNVNQVSGRTIDPEKGRDHFIVDWYGPEDPEVIRPLICWIILF